MEQIIEYRTTGTCCSFMQVKFDNETIVDVEFFGGCPGNLIGIKNLVKGMTIEEVISKFDGIKCGDKQTSCPDQLAKCLKDVLKTAKATRQ